LRYIIFGIRAKVSLGLYLLLARFPHPQTQTQNHPQNTSEAKRQPCPGSGSARPNRAMEHDHATLQS